MLPTQIVLDTSVLVAGLRSSRGASFQLLQRIGQDSRFEINLSVPLVLEYESVLKRAEPVDWMSDADADTLIDYLCAQGNPREVHFLWRPVLRDPDDDMVLELAVEARAEVIVTFNVKDFDRANHFGIRAMTPREFLEFLEEQ